MSLTAALNAECLYLACEESMALSTPYGAYSIKLYSNGHLVFGIFEDFGQTKKYLNFSGQVFDRAQMCRSKIDIQFAKL